MSYDWNCGLLLRLDSRVIHDEKMKMYDWIVAWFYL